MGGNEVHQLAGRVDELMAEIEEFAVPTVAARVDELVRTLVELYGVGLDRTVDLLSGGEPIGREAMLRQMAADDLLAALLVLHDLHPDDLTTRVTHALDEVRPYLGSHAGGVELVGVDDAADGAVVRLRLEGSCDGCASSSETVRNAIQQAVLGAAPDVARIDVEGMAAASPASTLLQIQPYRGGRPEEAAPVPEAEWQHLGDLDVPPRALRSVATAGEPMLVANLDGTLLAYRDRCPGCGSPASSGALAGDVLTCAGCATSYDVRRAGRSADGSGGHLEPLPLLPEDSGWKVALPVRVGT